MNTFRENATMNLNSHEQIQLFSLEDADLPAPLLPAKPSSGRFSETGMAFEAAGRIASPSGAQLYLRHAPAEGDAKAVILILHGLSEHAGRYRKFAEFLAARGFAVYAHDQRGHGRTTADDAPIGRYAWRDGPEKLTEDVLAMRAHALSRHPGLPVILFGHSMGGIIAAYVAEHAPDAFDALAVWNSHLYPGFTGRVGVALLKGERFFKGSDVPSQIAPRLTFEAWAARIPGARTHFDWLSRDPAAVAAYLEDPLCAAPPSVSLWIDLLTMAGTAGRRAMLARLPKDLPVHLAGGSGDPSTEDGEMLRRLAANMARVGMRDVTLTIHEGMRHETLNEYGSDQAMEAFASWLDRVALRQGCNCRKTDEPLSQAQPVGIINAAPSAAPSVRDRT